MVPTAEETQATPAQAGQAAQAEAQGERIITTVVIGPTLDGIGFAPLKSDPTRFLSAPILDATVVARLCTIPEFERANGISDDDLKAVDTAIGRVAQDDRDRRVGKVYGEDPLVLRRTVDELTRANLAMTADRDKAREERDDAIQRMSAHENSRLHRELDVLRHERDDGGGASIALQTENETLRKDIERLGDRLSTVLEENARLKAKLDAPDADE